VGQGGLPVQPRRRGRAAWLAQRMAKTPIAGLLRIAWDSEGGSGEVQASGAWPAVWPCPRGLLDARAEHLGRAPPLVGWSRSASTSSQTAAASANLTTVADHQTLARSCGAQRAATARVAGVLHELGEPKHSIRAVSIDMSGGYAKAIGDNTHAEICFDAFPVVRLAQRAVEQVRCDESNATSAPTPPRTARSRTPDGRRSRAPTSRPSRSSRCSAKSSITTRSSPARLCPKAPPAQAPSRRARPRARDLHQQSRPGRSRDGRLTRSLSTKTNPHPNHDTTDTKGKRTPTDRLAAHSGKSHGWPVTPTGSQPTRTYRPAQPCTPTAPVCGETGPIRAPSPAAA
jgi:Transposase